MGRLKDKILYSAAGISGGLSGLAFISRCAGNACTSCLGCGGVGIVILFITVVKKMKGGLKNNGLASGNN